jgi:hypothetical protein
VMCCRSLITLWRNFLFPSSGCKCKVDIKRWYRCRESGNWGQGSLTLGLPSPSIRTSFFHAWLGFLP